jgi:hypothetical protein
MNGTELDGRAIKVRRSRQQQAAARRSAGAGSSSDGGANGAGAAGAAGSRGGSAAGAGTDVAGRLGKAAHVLRVSNLSFRVADDELEAHFSDCEVPWWLPRGCVGAVSAARLRRQHDCVGSTTVSASGVW